MATTAESSSPEDVSEAKGEQAKQSAPPSDGSGDGPSTTAENPNAKYMGITKLRNFIRVRRLELAMLVSRILTMYFAFFFIVPIFGGQAVFLRRALIANAATSGLRLYQRLARTPFSISKEFMAHVVIEDSFHHLTYSLMFLYFGVISFVLIPVFLFASLNTASFTLQMLEVVKGPKAKFTGLGSFLFFCVSRTPWILKLAATAEVGLMGVILFQCFRGYLSIIAPLMYYRFLYLRYASKRNHYTRVVFFELRMAAERVIAHGCPTLIARIVRGIITVVCKLAPGTVNR